MDTHGLTWTDALLGLIMANKVSVCVYVGPWLKNL